MWEARRDSPAALNYTQIVRCKNRRWMIEIWRWEERKEGRIDKFKVVKYLVPIQSRTPNEIPWTCQTKEFTAYLKA